MDSGEGWRQSCHDLTPSGRGTSPGGKRRLIRGGGSAEVRVSAVSVDATRKRVDQPVSTVPDSVDVDINGVLQRDGPAQSGSGLPLRGRGCCRCGLRYFCGRTAGLYVPEWC